MRKVRQGTVEPVLGTLVNFTRMKKVNTKGIALANKCMIMAAVAYNLKKLMKLKPSLNEDVPDKQSGNPGMLLNKLVALICRPINVYPKIKRPFNRKEQTTYWSFAL